MDNSPTFLRVSELSVNYRKSKSRSFKTVVDGISFNVRKRRTMGLGGESGSGKTSTALAVMRIIEASGGSIHLGDIELTSLSGKELRRQRPRFQMIFQDPSSSLNPRMRARDILTEPMLLCSLGTKSQREEKACRLFEQVGLPTDGLALFPHQFSGGQRQRLAIARALSTSPELVVADEPVSALDAAIQAQILNLLSDLRESYGLTVLFISHDLSVIQHTCHDLCVMNCGEIVEMAETTDFFASPAHPYSWALLCASIPGGYLKDELKKTFGLVAEKDNGLSTGCTYHGCPLRQEQCRKDRPELTAISPGHLSRCHFAQEVQSAGSSIIKSVLFEPERKVHLH